MLAGPRLRAVPSVHQLFLAIRLLKRPGPTHQFVRPQESNMDTHSEKYAVSSLLEIGLVLILILAATLIG